ncbi:MAG: cytochrome c biogenesis protein ResB [Deltaproteobacteria bacterium]|nr:cytochrome c biogenesis protein ResB [Deltaproteobacteria bacterium]MCL5277697.1 cytochrome c biogenesis protein ResB [Deltaproteobacteria bacterium]
MDKVLDRIWRFFSSVKLAIVLIISIVATAIIGTVIQQGLPVETYVRHYGASTYRLLHFFDLFDMYHSWWFELLLILFIVNVTVCTLERLPAIFKMVSKPKLKIPMEKINAFKERQTVSYGGRKEALIASLVDRLKESYRRPVHTSSEEGDFIYLEKGRIARFGPYVTHLSLIIIFIGVLVGSFLGFDAYVNLSPGDATDIVRTTRGNQDLTLPFTIKCNDFHIEFYDSGIPKAYKSDLSLLRDNRQIARKVIDVNQPLTYRGITIYQASYGQAGASDFSIVLTSSNDGEEDLSLARNQLFPLKGDISIAVLDYSRNYQGFGPTILVGVYKGQKLQSTSIYLEKYPDFHGAEKIEGYGIRFIKAHESYYTGLQVAKDPGAPYVAGGAIVLIIGLLMSFFSYRRRVWLFIPEKFDGTFTVAGVADRNKYSFEFEFEKLVGSIREICSPTVEGKDTVPPSPSDKGTKDGRR